MKPSDLILTALLGALLIGCFSLWGPVEVSAPTLDGPGLEKPGESSLVVSGSGAEVVNVIARSPEGDVAIPEGFRNVGGDCHGPAALAMTEEPDALTGYWYGVGAVLLGQVVILMFGRRNYDD